MIVANFMDSSLLDLQRKGVSESISETYNAFGAYERVLHFTPHSRDLDVAEALREQRIEIKVHRVSGIEPIKILCAVGQVWKILGEERVDLVRGRLPYTGSLVGGLAARLRGLPFVVSLGGDNRIPQQRDGFYYGSRRISFAIENAVLRLATRIIVPNRFTKNYVRGILGEDLAEKKCSVIGWLSPAVPESNPDDDSILHGIGFSSNDVVLPVIGFVNRYKYSHILFEVLERGPLLTKDGRPAIVCFAGDGPLRAEGERRFSNRNDVRFLGWQEKAVVQALLRRAQAVIIPMSGFVLLEAASLGKPVITSSVEWHSELVTNQVSGLLVDPEDPEAWRDAVTDMLARPEIACARGRALRGVYEKDFSLDACVLAEHALYEELTGKPVRA